MTESGLRQQSQHTGTPQSTDYKHIGIIIIIENLDVYDLYNITVSKIDKFASAKMLAGTHNIIIIIV